MKIRYFADTDTMLIEFRDEPVAETRELDENTILDLDARGNIRSITVERGNRSWMRLSVPRWPPGKGERCGSMGACAPMDSANAPGLWTGHALQGRGRGALLYARTNSAAWRGQRGALRRIAPLPFW
jgi:uncharacterized protein YuzE